MREAELPQGKRGDVQDRPVIKQKVEIIPNAPTDEPIEAAVRDLPQEDATQNPQHQRRRPGRGARLQEREVFQPFLSKVMAFPGNTYRYVRANPQRALAYGSIILLSLMMIPLAYYMYNRRFVVSPPLAHDALHDQHIIGKDMQPGFFGRLFGRGEQAKADLKAEADLKAWEAKGFLARTWDRLRGRAYDASAAASATSDAAKHKADELAHDAKATANDAKHAAENLAEQAKHKANELIDDAKAKAAELSDKAAHLADHAKAKANDATANAKATAEVGKASAEGFFANLRHRLAGLFGRAQAGANDAAAAAALSAHEAKEAAKEKAHEAKEAAAEKADDAKHGFAHIKEMASEKLDDIKEAAEHLKDRMFHAGAAATDTVSGKAAEGAGAIKGGFLHAKEKLADAAEDTTDKLKLSYKDIKKNAEDVKDSVSNKAQDASEATKEAVGEVTDKAREGLGGILDKASHVAHKLGEKLHGAAKEVKP